MMNLSAVQNTADTGYNHSLENVMTELTTMILSAQTLEGLPTAMLLDFYNEHADRPIKAFRNRAQAEERTLEIVAQLEGGGSDEEPAEASPGLLTALVGQVVAEPTEEPAEPALISLADICAQVQVVPRIARRRLRKARGLLTEGRWEFTPEEVDEVMSIICPKAATPE